MNHRSYDGQRFSPLARINKDNVKGLKLAFAVPLAGGAGKEFIEATPLAEDGFLYITDSWGVLYKIDATSGDVGRIVWRMDPKQEKQVANRGAALWGNLVISPRASPARIIATDKNSGKVVWETNVSDGDARITVTGAPLAIKDKIVFGASGGDSGARDWIGGARCRDRQAAVAQIHHPGAGRAGQRDLEGQDQCLADRRRRRVGHRHLRSRHQPDAVGCRQSGADDGCPARPGDNLFTNSVVSWNPDNGKMNWYFQFTPGDMWDFDEVGTHILFERTIDGQRRKLVTHSARNGFLYTMERNNGAIVGAKPYMEVNWTKGIDQKTGKPLDYDPAKDVQTYSGLADPTSANPVKKVCPTRSRRQQLLPVLLQPEDPAPLHSGDDRLRMGHQRQAIGASASEGWFVRSGGGYKVDGRYESNLTAVDPVTQEIKKKMHLAYPNYSGALSTAGGLVFVALIDGTVAAFDDTTLDEFWKINLGSGFCAPPMTFEVNGKQYVAIASGPSAASRTKLLATPELKDQRNATVLYVFGL